MAYLGYLATKTDYKARPKNRLKRFMKMSITNLPDSDKDDVTPTRIITSRIRLDPAWPSHRVFLDKVHCLFATQS